MAAFPSFGRNTKVTLVKSGGRWKLSQPFVPPGLAPTAAAPASTAPVNRMAARSSATSGGGRLGVGGAFIGKLPSQAAAIAFAQQHLPGFTYSSSGALHTFTVSGDPTQGFSVRWVLLSTDPTPSFFVAPHF